MNVYGQAMTDSKRYANSQVVSLIFGVQPDRQSVCRYPVSLGSFGAASE